jgi:hypothetical protein
MPCRKRSRAYARVVATPVAAILTRTFRPEPLSARAPGAIVVSAARHNTY